MYLIPAIVMGVLIGVMLSRCFDTCTCEEDDGCSCDAECFCECVCDEEVDDVIGQTGATSQPQLVHRTETAPAGQALHELDAPPAAATRTIPGWALALQVLMPYLAAVAAALTLGVIYAT